MNSVMAWIKANVPIVVLSAVIILVLPAAFVGSSMWNKKIRTKREADASRAMTDLSSLKISYNQPSAVPGGTPITLALDAPNPTATAYFKEHRTKLDEQVAQVAGVASKINQNGHGLLVDGLFVAPPAPVDPSVPPGAPVTPGSPAPTGAPAVPALPAAPGTPPPAANSVDPIKAIELSELIIGRPDKPSIYQKELDNIHAGGPADAIKIAEQLDEIRQQVQDEVKAKSNRTQLTDDEKIELNKKLVDTRIAAYRQHAGEISVYATRDALPLSIPRQALPQTPDAPTCYTWHYDYWMTSDLLHAVDAANTFNGQRTTLEQSVVKRIVRIVLDEPYTATEPSITGRKSGGDNKLYDVRDATLNVVVASSRLPELVNAISRTNFMTVIGVTFNDVDPYADLDQGYFYGADHVVKASLRIETVWLRSWTEALMPQQIRDLLTPPVAETAVTPAPTPPPAATSKGSGNKSKPPPGPKGKKGRRGGDEGG